MSRFTAPTRTARPEVLRSGLTRWTEPVGPLVRRVRRSLSHVPWLLSCGFWGPESVLEMGLAGFA